MKYIFLAIGMLAALMSLNSCELEKVHPAALRVEFNSIADCYTVSFSSTSSEQQNWDFGDGTTSTETNPTHTYEAAGQYEVTLSILSEKAAGELSKSVAVNPSGTSFREDHTSHRGMALSKNPLGPGYRIIGNDNTSQGVSVLSYSKEGKFESILIPGSSSRDYIAYFNPRNTFLSVYNNTSNSSITWALNDPNVGNAQIAISKVDTSLFATQALINENEKTFIAGVYGSGGLQGVFLTVISLEGLKTTLLELPIDLSPPNNVYVKKIGMDITPDGGVMIAFLVPGTGIYIAKFNELGQQIWNKYLEDSNFLVNSLGSNQPYVSLLALGNDDYVVGTAEYIDFNGLPEVNANANGFVIRGNENAEIWRKTIAGATHLNTMLLSKKGEILVAGGFNDNSIIVPYLVKLNQEGDILFAKEVLQDREAMLISDMLETDNEEFLLLGETPLGISLVQVDCGGSF